MDINSLTSLENCHDGIERLVNWYPEAGHLTCTADDKMRAETMRAIRDKVIRDISSGKPDPAGWNAASPWTCVYRLAAADAN